ncbi:hypothetical protein [Palleronia sp.]|uniref:hypothetical protein n=1 Tax=Palleronia sp. TaxID=1940284 RepID=UPI0035C804EE
MSDGAQAIAPCGSETGCIDIHRSPGFVASLDVRDRLDFRVAKLVLLSIANEIAGTLASADQPLFPQAIQGSTGTGRESRTEWWFMAAFRLYRSLVLLHKAREGFTPGNPAW